MVEQLYSPDRDEQAREAGLVYIEDLALSSAMIALKVVCAPRGSGFFDHQPIGGQDLSELHDDLVTGVGKVSSEPGLLSRLVRGEAAWNTHYRSERDFYLQFERFNGKVEVAAGNSGYWDGRPFQIRKFMAGENLDPATLTGFDPFNPTGFDSYQDTPGIAQSTIDALRRTGDPLSIDVAVHEAGRTLERAKAVKVGVDHPDTNSELASAMGDALRGTLDLTDR
ncbi:MAG TPA: hypothetical protein VII55_01900 [Candidatus Saccharimonadales bacterium]